MMISHMYTIGSTRGYFNMKIMMPHKGTMTSNKHNIQMIYLTSSEDDLNDSTKMLISLKLYGVVVVCAVCLPIHNYDF